MSGPVLLPEMGRTGEREAREYLVSDPRIR